ncbi:hypothetical protein AB0758_33145 [Tolypothrix bouteillei VB521301_2]|uniref:Uncharacterized protein n=1 Tax=Tolypothrix bouteillei VB521301 TaxID=1479485 RepID=A0A8S9SXI4_9CYAN|nr:hypothetical protein [Tolypothrix bouteillei]KAF3884062.1 hypothetical protein DA73_0400000015 [Tolypothrix bouteillei VB521301]
MAEFNGTEFNNFAKRLQSALKRRNISVSLSQIKESISALIASCGNRLTEEVQHVCLDSLIRKYQSSSLVEPESVIEPVIYESEEASSDSTTDSRAIVQSERQTRDLVSSKASSMGIVLSEADIVAIANQLDYQVDSSVEDVIAEAEALLIAYADHVKQQSKQKVTAMINRVYSHVGDNNTEVSQHLSEGLQQFASDLGVSQQEFKRQAKQALSCLRISKNSA